MNAQVLIEENRELQTQLQLLEQQNRSLKSQLDWLTRQLFGKRSERILDQTDQEQLFFEGFGIEKPSEKKRAEGQRAYEKTK